MNPVTGLSIGRIAIGALAIARPTDAAKAFGLDPISSPQVAYMTRLFGAREAALGLVTLAASGRGRTGIVMIGIAVDLADAATGYLGTQERQVSQQTAMKLMGPAGGAVLAGLLGLRVKKKVVTA